MSAGSPPSTSVRGEPGTEQRIFDAALSVFARKGRDGARMQEIADVAGINRALLHYYFRSKSHLYEAVFAHGFRQWVGSFGQALRAESSFRDSVRAFVDGYIDYIHDHQDMARLMLNECLAGGPLLGAFLTAAMEDEQNWPGFVLEGRMEEAITAGEIRDVDVRHTILTIVSACLFFFIALPTVVYFHPQAGEDFDAFVEARKAHVVDLVLNGLVDRSGGAA